MKMKVFLPLFFFSGLLSVVFPCAVPAREITSEFKVGNSAVMDRSVRFWTRIFTEYTSKEAVLHDAKYPDLIYEAVENDPKTVRRAMDRWRKALIEAYEAGGEISSLSGDARKAAELFKGIDDESDALIKAAHRKRLRSQTGHKESFLDAYASSGRYLPKFEEIFVARGVPWEITRIPFVESGFRVDARSSTGALGIWQFMETTAKLYLRVNSAVDERRDPYFAADAAARLFQDNYDSLGNWPLAVTAYNHGRRNLMRAVRQVGTSDLSDLVRSNRARNFGFSGKNYFAELVAILAIEKNPGAAVTGSTKREDPDRFVDIVLPQALPMARLSKALGVQKAELSKRNPALLPSVVKGRARIPAGARIHVNLREGETEETAKVRVERAIAKLLPRPTEPSQVQNRR